MNGSHRLLILLATAGVPACGASVPAQGAPPGGQPSPSSTTASTASTASTAGAATSTTSTASPTPATSDSSSGARTAPADSGPFGHFRVGVEVGPVAVASTEELGAFSSVAASGGEVRANIGRCENVGAEDRHHSGCGDGAGDLAVNFSLAYSAFTSRTNAPLVGINDTLDDTARKEAKQPTIAERRTTRPYLVDLALDVRYTFAWRIFVEARAGVAFSPLVRVWGLGDPVVEGSSSGPALRTGHVPEEFGALAGGGFGLSPWNCGEREKGSSPCFSLSVVPTLRLQTKKVFVTVPIMLGVSM
ncbi:MAG TPA: hypothetical protein PLR99_10215 [Polyangiaceae bacterium]|nr:hypothetical protein [Polyangiaceae bacterium]